MTDRRLSHAIADARRGLPVMVTHAGSTIALVAMERLDASRLATLQALGDGARAQPLIAGGRAEALKVGSKGRAAVRLVAEDWMTVDRLMAMGDPSRDLDFPLSGPFRRDEVSGAADAAGLDLLKLARLLPAAMIIEPAEAAIINVGPPAPIPASAVADWREAAETRLSIVARAPVPLADAPQAEIIAFRPADGGAEHYALLIGDPPRAEPVLTRLHSECFTGDLLGSLKCDCGDQLRGAIARIAAAGGGLLLYLAQEGRGIGLIAKLKAYALQAQGHDTVDANLKLGFADDERDFRPAAAMLRALGFEGVRLLSNNPAKLAGLEAAGIPVIERIPHQFPANPHNAGYLATKRTRSGHQMADHDHAD